MNDQSFHDEPAGAPTNATGLGSVKPRRLGSKVAFVIWNEIGNLQLRLRLVNFILLFCPNLTFGRLRTAVYRLCGVRIGPGTSIIGNLSLAGSGPISRRLRVGKACCLNAPLHLDLNAEITIGDGVAIGHHVVFLTSEHEIGSPSYRCGVSVYKPITVGDGCWIGAGSTILPGVTIGEGSIVSAGSVVSAPVPPNKLVAGNPARPIKSLLPDE